MSENPGATSKNGNILPAGDGPLKDVRIFSAFVVRRVPQHVSCEAFKFRTMSIPSLPRHAENRLLASIFLILGVQKVEILQGLSRPYVVEFVNNYCKTICK